MIVRVLLEAFVEVDDNEPDINFLNDPVDKAVDQIQSGDFNNVNVEVCVPYYRGWSHYRMNMSKPIGYRISDIWWDNS